jgi:hypothetical protein
MCSIMSLKYQFLIKFNRKLFQKKKKYEYNVYYTLRLLDCEKRLPQICKIKIELDIHAHTHIKSLSRMIR